MERLQGSYLSIDQMADAFLQNGKKAEQKAQINEQGFTFQQIFRQASEQHVNSVAFSKHANERLASRNINLDAHSRYSRGSIFLPSRTWCIFRQRRDNGGDFLEAFVCFSDRRRPLCDYPDFN